MNIVVAEPSMRAFGPKYVPRAGDGCVLWMPGQDDAQSATLRDRSGKANNGTIAQASWVREGRGLWSLSFDGTDDYVDMGTGASLDVTTGDVSVEMWVYVGTQTENNPMLFNKGGHGLTVAGYAFEGGTIAGGTAERPVFEVSDGGGVAGDSQSSNRVPALNDSKWHYLVGVLDKTADTIDVYYDGASQTPVSLGGTVGSITNPTRVAYLGGITTGNNFNGKIALVRVRTRLLSAAEILWTYRQERGMFV